jgi:hypothetical protein
VRTVSDHKPHHPNASRNLNAPSLLEAFKLPEPNPAPVALGRPKSGMNPETPDATSIKTASDFRTRVRLLKIASKLRAQGRTSDTLEIAVRDWMELPETRHVVTLRLNLEYEFADPVLVVDGEQIIGYSEIAHWLNEVRSSIAAGTARRVPEGGAR